MPEWCCQQCSHLAMQSLYGGTHLWRQVHSREWDWHLLQCPPEMIHRSDVWWCNMMHSGLCSKHDALRRDRSQSLCTWSSLPPTQPSSPSHSCQVEARPQSILPDQDPLRAFLLLLVYRQQRTGISSFLAPTWSTGPCLELTNLGIFNWNTQLKWEEWLSKCHLCCISSCNQFGIPVQAGSPNCCISLFSFKAAVVLLVILEVPSLYQRCLLASCLLASLSFSWCLVWLHSQLIQTPWLGSLMANSQTNGRVVNAPANVC